MELTNQNLLSAHKMFENKGVYDLLKICLREIDVRNMAEWQVITENEFHGIYSGSDEWWDLFMNLTEKPMDCWSENTQNVARWCCIDAVL